MWGRAWLGCSTSTHIVSPRLEPCIPGSRHLAEILSGTVRSTFLFLNEGYTKTLSVGTIEVICLGEQEDLLGRVTDLLDNPLQPGVAVHELLLPVEFIMLPGTPANF